MINNNNFKKQLILFFIWLALAILPASIIFIGVNRYLNLENEVQLTDLNSKFRRLAGDLQKYQNIEAFITKTMFNGINPNREIPGSEYEYVALCQEMAKYRPDDLIVFVADDKDNIVFKTANLSISNEELLKVFSICFNRKVLQQDMDIFRPVLGNQLVMANFTFNAHDSGFKFINADNSGKKLPFFIIGIGKYRFCIWATRRFLNSIEHINFISKKFADSNKLNVGSYLYNDIKDTIHLNNNKQLDTEVKDEICSRDGHGSVWETCNYWICNQYISNNTGTFVYVRKKFSDARLILIPLGLIAVYFLIFSSIYRYCFNKIVLNKAVKTSIRTKLAVIVLFASCISLILLYFVCKEYEIHKKHCLVTEAKQYSENRLFELNNRYEAFLNKIAIDVDHNLDLWSYSLKNRELNINDVILLNSILGKYNIDNYYCVASDSARWLERSGCCEYSGSLDNIKLIPDKSEYLNNDKNIDFKQFKFINLIAKRVCADINEIPLSRNLMSKLDLIAETFTKGGFVELVYSVVKNLKQIFPWGYANRNYMAYFKLININDELKSDYLFCCFWHKSQLINDFLKNFMPVGNRNIKNFKYLYYSPSGAYLRSSEFKNEELLQYAMKANVDEDNDYRIITVDNVPYLVTDYKCPSIANVVFLGMYPVSNIETSLRNSVSLLWILLVFTAILIFFAIGLLSNYFIVPLKSLEKKALALENKEYDCKSENNANDEFGQLNNTFNEAMESMKELELARLIQEGMFPKSDFEQCEFKIYGKSEVMTVVGGDYFDIFPVMDNSFVALLGDVAGHGVGASVLMAMAKSAIIAGKEKYRSPAAMLNYLHKMVLATKTDKQKKIMTFQYLYMNSESGESLYGNAGGCAPCVVRGMGEKVEELKMPGPVLGAFKKASYKEMPLTLENGDALIFYTDGIVEAKNSEGVMLGYEALFEIFKQSYHANPEQYYKNIYSEYLEHIKGLEPQDDMTIVVIVRQSKKARLWDNVELLDLA